jgi:methylase of polypeptide subunit release factors
MSTSVSLATDRDAAATVRAAFADNDYTVETVRRLLRTKDQVSSTALDKPVHERRLAGDRSVTALLLRLFLVDLDVDRVEVTRALGPALGAFLALGMLEDDGDAVRAAVRVMPHDGLLVCSDTLRTPDDPNHVAGIHAPTRSLATLTIRQPVRLALDVGTGNGVQALLAARHADHVVATDVNERALDFARFNATLNGLENIEFRSGSLLEPVAGERFDLIVANPPYVISPRTDYVFRDSGLGRDRISRHLVEALPAHLTDGGFATALISWISADDDISTEPREWLEGSGCDAWLLHSAIEDPLSAASTWNSDVGDPVEYAERVDEWLAYYRKEHIDWIAYAAIVLRRRDADNWFRSLLLPRVYAAPSDHLELLFRAQDELSALSDEALLDRVVTVVPHTVFEHRNRIVDGEWKTAEAVVTIPDGLGLRAKLDGPSAALVSSLAPARSVREALAAAAALQGMAVDAEFVGAGLSLLRGLIERGYVELR